MQKYQKVVDLYDSNPDFRAEAIVLIEGYKIHKLIRHLLNSGVNKFNLFKTAIAVLASEDPEEEYRDEDTVELAKAMKSAYKYYIPS